jgi:hypothetical protein
LTDLTTRLDLQFAFRAVHDFDLPEVGADAYVVELKSEGGDLVLQLNLPTHLVENAVLTAAQPFLTMSPDGWLAIQYVSVTDEPPILGRIAIEAIIEQAIAPPMLEDELTVDTMLEELRNKLKRALDMVEATIAHL